MNNLPLYSTSNPFMAVPTPQEKVPQLQREAASIQPEKVDPRSARNLLRKAFKRGWVALPTARDLQNEQLAFLLDTPIGRDFNLITSAGVEFKVHSVMLLGGSKFLQEGLFPGGATPSVPVTFVNLPPHFYPILIDRMVTFIYTSDYAFTSSPSDHQLQKSNFKFYNATLIPDANPLSPATTALVGTRDYMFHLRMYALGEELDYDRLKRAAHAKLFQILLVQKTQTPATVKEVVEATFAPPDDLARSCKDEDGALQQLVVAAVLAHEGKCWTEKQRKEFTDSIQAPGYAPFRNAYDVVKTENEDLLKTGGLARALAEERKKATEQRRRAKTGTGGEGMTLGSGGMGSPTRAVLRKTKEPNQFKKRHEGKRAATTPKVGVDEDVEMEVD